MDDLFKTLGEIVDKYGVPDPKIVGKLPKSGVTLDYVGHAEITRILLEIDPLWTIEPVATDASGCPAVRANGRMVEAAFWMTVCGHRRYCIGSVEARKADGDLGKELLSDAIRNGAMRYGVALSLWSKEEWAPAAPAAPAPDQDSPISESQHAKFVAACEAAGIDPDQVASHADVTLDHLPTIGEFTRMRAAFKTLNSKEQK